jgi:hypothetical protein
VHLIITGCWLALALIGPEVGLLVLQRSSVVDALHPLTEPQSAIRSRHSVRPVKVMSGTSVFASMRSGTTTQSYLQVEVQSTDPRVTPDALQRAIAGTVLDLDPNLPDQQILVVVVHRRIDLGLVNRDDANRTALDAAAWREKLARTDTHPLRL